MPERTCEITSKTHPIFVEKTSRYERVTFDAVVLHLYILVASLGLRIFKPIFLTAQIDRLSRTLVVVEAISFILKISFQRKIGISPIRIEEIATRFKVSSDILSCRPGKRFPRTFLLTLRPRQDSTFFTKTCPSRYFHWMVCHFRICE